MEKSMKKFSPIDNVNVYDDAFSLSKQQDIFSFCRNSKFSIVGWNDLTNTTESYTHSNWSKEDLENSKFFDTDNTKRILSDNNLSIDKFSRCVVNVDTLSDSHWPHTHSETVVLYYLNMEWQDGWGGETLFYDEGNKEIIYGSKFTPNRVVVFDGNIPHNIKHQNRIADKYRMSLSIFFNK